MLRTHLTLAACLLISHVTLGAQHYSIQLVVDAGDPQHHSASPTALTDDGLVGGRIWNVDLFQFDAFAWRDGQMTTVVQSPAGSSGVTAINSTGIVVGTTFVPTLPAGNDTFVYRDGATTLYPATTFAPYGINDDGIMAGSTGAHAATFDGRAVTDLGTFGGTVARGVAINESGQVVSEATFRPPGQDIPASRAFLWDGTAGVQLPSLGGTEDHPRAINDAGVIVGSSNLHAVRWADGAVTTLGELTGDDSSGAGSINSAGVIVGESILTDETRQRAVRWDDNGVADLNTLIPPDSGWDLWSATAINDKGQIVGYGRYNGDSAVFLLTPDGLSATVPEPAACMLVGLASAGLLLRRRRQR